jgi:hypothetical protein
MISPHKIRVPKGRIFSKLTGKHATEGNYGIFAYLGLDSG